MFYLFFLFPLMVLAQELEVNTSSIDSLAQIKNCLDFNFCSPYEDSLKKDQGIYRWKAHFKVGLKALEEKIGDCRISNKDFTVLARSEDGLVSKTFRFPVGRKDDKDKIRYFPMELRTESLIGLHKKESAVDTLLRSDEAMKAMKSTVFEFEYSLGEYELKLEKLPPNILGRTYYIQKYIGYDVDKWDQSVCRFYEIMRHEVQHVRNIREVESCRGNHHFLEGNNNDISAYFNDLAFIKRFCPHEKELFEKVENVLFSMYDDRSARNSCSGHNGMPEDSSKTTLQYGKSTLKGNHRDPATSVASPQGFNRKSQNYPVWKKHYQKDPTPPSSGLR